jgi:hypothetical protein
VQLEHAELQAEQIPPFVKVPFGQAETQAELNK